MSPYRAGKVKRNSWGSFWHVGWYLSEEGSGRSFFCSAACCSLTNIRDTTISPNISLAILSALPPLHHCHLVSASLSRSMESKEKVLRVSCKSCPDWKWPFELLSPIAMVMMMTMVISMHKTMMVTVTVMVRDWKRFFEFLSVFMMTSMTMKWTIMMTMVVLMMIISLLYNVLVDKRTENEQQSWNLGGSHKSTNLRNLAGRPQIPKCPNQTHLCCVRAQTLMRQSLWMEEKTRRQEFTFGSFAKSTIGNTTTSLHHICVFVGIPCVSFIVSDIRSCIYIELVLYLITFKNVKSKGHATSFVYQSWL